SDFGFRHTWEFLRRRWKTPAVCIFLAWVLAIVYCVTGVEWYESRGDLFLVQKDPNIATNSSTSLTGKDSEISEDLLATPMQLIHSEKIVKAALSKYVRRSVLEELKAKQKHAEEQTSENLRLKFSRLLGYTPIDAELPVEEGEFKPFVKIEDFTQNQPADGT